MDFSKILPILSNIAPSIATALGGPAAGMAVNALSQLFGIEPASPDANTQLQTALATMSPDTAAKIRAADQDFAQKMKSLDIDLEKLNAADRDSARKMQETTHDWTPSIIAGVVCMGLFALLFLMSFFSLPTANHDAMMMLLGSLSTAFASVVAFYFGSSSSSKTKDDTIKTLSVG